MDAPKCMICGVIEWRHVCSGSAGKPKPKSKKTGRSERPRIDERQAVNIPVPPVSAALAPVSTIPVSTSRAGDRHSLGYQRDLMRARRAVKSGRAEPYPRRSNAKT